MNKYTIACRRCGTTTTTSFLNRQVIHCLGCHKDMKAPFNIVGKYIGHKVIEIKEDNHDQVQA